MKVAVKAPSTVAPEVTTDKASADVNAEAAMLEPTTEPAPVPSIVKVAIVVAPFLTVTVPAPA